MTQPGLFSGAPLPPAEHLPRVEAKIGEVIVAWCHQRLAQGRL